jgi:hypothetical protein
MKTIRYITVLELLIFIGIGGLSISVFINDVINGWILALILVLSYLFLLGGTSILKVQNESIRITYLNPLLGITSIDFNDIIKIETEQNFEQETAMIDSIYYVLRIKYKIEYKDKKDKIKKVEFKINNNKKEKEIMESVKNGWQQKP